MRLNLSSILGVKINNGLEYYLNKIILFNNKINNIYIWLTLILLVLVLAFSAYTYGDLYANIDTYVSMYLNLKK